MTILFISWVSVDVFNVTHHNWSNYSTLAWFCLNIPLLYIENIGLNQFPMWNNRHLLEHYITLVLPYSLNISREKIFADFKVVWLTMKILSLKILGWNYLPLKILGWNYLRTCGTYIWLVFCPDVLLQYYKFIGA